MPAVQEEERELLQIQDFRKGYIYFLSSLQSLSGAFLQFLTSGNISEGNKRDLLPLRKLLDSELNKSQKKIKDIIINLDEKHLYPYMKKEYNRYFPAGLADEARNEFVQFHIIFEMLRNFYIESKVSWEEIKKAIESANFHENEFRNDSLLGFRVIPALDRLVSLSIFLKRMSHVLQIEKPETIWEPRATKPKFKENVTYRLSSVFSESLYQTEFQEVMTHSPFPEEPLEKKQSPPETKSQEIPESKKTTPRKESIVNYIQAYGKYSWNSDQHYFFRFETDKYKEEKDYFKQTISMDLHMGADEQILRSELIRSLTSLERKSKSAEELEKDYLNFLDRFFDFCENIIMMNINIPSQLKWVFLFHIGPSHFYMIAKKFLTEVNTGFLHLRSLDGKKVSRVIPTEVVKKNVIDYWNRVVLPNVGEEKNNLAILKRLSEVVENCYKEVSAHTIQCYEDLPSEIKASKPRVQLFREYMNQWMGAANIIVFKRFVKNKSF
ncbi:hypothetical protein [Leptospira ilyithenensis]|uniref:Uncharacterized protein n=1 Tax=Leptospira ilyithenensis TaxID=2484901 RepID=A0A4R9LQ70_9LEPT|nr:hypothetical protein [Leptospira ilyithenensis]TGN11171.1 hypothetical protein EHS11_08445 [Leptospira ilyithenensis]